MTAEIVPIILLNENNFQVNGVEMSSADHELAVKAIQTSGNPLKFIVQSLEQTVKLYDSSGFSRH